MWAAGMLVAAATRVMYTSRTSGSSRTRRLIRKQARVGLDRSAYVGKVEVDDGCIVISGDFVEHG
jgi:hypothetical protein